MCSHRPARIVIVGAGGHGRVIADVATRQFPDASIIFLDDKLAGSTVDGRPVLGRFQDWRPILEALIRETDTNIGVVLGLGDNQLRQRWALALGSWLQRHALAEFLTVVDPSAVVSSGAVVGPGTVVFPQVVVNTGSRVGAHVILNTACSVDHDAQIGDYVHISPGAHLAGEVQVDDGTHIGTGASIIPRIHVGAWSVIGAGSTVTRNIPSGVVAFGVPARVQRSLAPA